MPTKNKPTFASDVLQSPPEVEEDKFAHTGGLVMSRESPKSTPAASDMAARTEGAGGLLMSREVEKFPKESKKDAPKIVLPDIAPQWQSLPADEIKGHLRDLAAWLRDRGATVRGPSFASMSAENGEAAATTDNKRQSKKSPDSAETVFEARFGWEYPKAEPITVVAASRDELEALRFAAAEAYHRRHEV